MGREIKRNPQQAARSSGPVHNGRHCPHLLSFVFCFQTRHTFAHPIAAISGPHCSSRIRTASVPHEPAKAARRHRVRCRLSTASCRFSACQRPRPPPAAAVRCEQVTEPLCAIALLVPRARGQCFRQNRRVLRRAFESNVTASRRVAVSHKPRGLFLAHF